ncbi:MAG: dihydroxyacetone kinase phosphoryl donor subunit DhaM [Pelolinea sp.]|nr:dihydroxyacetone kinase phosphoryl donor subunit DhaM [Pelolinea sp.]
MDVGWDWEMVNLLLVSHSKNLAESVADLAKQMIVSGAVKISIAAGIGEDHQEIGTNAVEIAEAIQDIYTNEGVLVLMDLGSAVLSAQLALDLIPPDVCQKVRICPAPFIEGAIVAAAQASSGSNLETVYREAMDALKPKYVQVREKIADAPEEFEKIMISSDDEEKKEIILTIQNVHGLHARPAVKFVQTAASFDAEIMVNNVTTNKGPASAKSLIAITMLGVMKGHQIQVTAMGQQREEALKALSDLVEDNFGEAPE